MTQRQRGFFFVFHCIQYAIKESYVVIGWDIPVTIEKWRCQFANARQDLVGLGDKLVFIGPDNHINYYIIPQQGVELSKGV